MCLSRRSWRKLHAATLFVLVTVVILLWVNVIVRVGAQSQDTINATVAEQARWNAVRIDRLEAHQEAVDGKVDKINWMLGVLSAQLIMEIIKFWHARTGSASSERPPRINERRSSERDD
jgi:hypothetical protein